MSAAASAHIAPAASAPPSLSSFDDKTESLDEEDEEHNPTRDTLAEGLVCFLKPTLDRLDASVASTRAAQAELKQQMDVLSSDLEAIAARAQNPPVDLDRYVQKLTDAKKKVVVINNVLQAAQDRLNRVHQACLKETAKQRTLME